MKKRNQKNPAENVISAFGGVRPLSRELGVNASTVSRWKSARSIPQKRWKAIMTLAKKRNKSFSLKDLFHS
ncbi:hypothetical protein EBT16_04705 [bacterium]|nr:hypothetical protein [bacterium]